MNDPRIDARTYRRILLLTLNAMLVLFLGCIGGMGLSAAIDAVGLHHDMIPGTAHAWHMAHLEGLLNGILMLAAAPAFAYLSLSQRAENWAFWSLIVTGWGNGVASILSPLTGGSGNDGITGVDWNTFTFFLFSAAVVGFLIVLIVFGVSAYKKARSHRKPQQ